MPNKVLGSILLILTLAIIGFGISDPAVIPPHPVPFLDKLEIVFGILMVVFSIWAGVRLIRSDKRPPGPPTISQ